MKISLTLSIFILLISFIFADKPTTFGWEEELGWSIRMDRGPRWLWGDFEAAKICLEWAGAKQESVEFYEMAYDVFAADPAADYLDLSQAPAIQKLHENQGKLLLGGPMLGTVGPDRVSVWTRTIKPASVVIEVNGDDFSKKYGPVQSIDQTDLSAVVPVTGLSESTRYSYVLRIDGKVVEPRFEQSFTTTPATNQRGIHRIAFGGDFHRRGMTQMGFIEQILEREPLAMLLLGDLAVSDRFNHRGFHRADYLLRDTFPAWQKLVSQTPVYAIWDDHDYLDNDLGGLPDGVTPQQRIEVWEVFRYSWNNPQYGFPDARKGVFQRTRIGPADVIMVDNKFFRKDLQSDEPSKLLGKDQMRWLEEQLLDCKGPFIILACGTMWTDHVTDGKDSWGQFAPEDRERLFKLIEDNSIGGVLLISGDRHGACGYRIPRQPDFNLYEFNVGALGGLTGKYAPASRAPEAGGLLQYRYGDGYAFGEFEFNTIPDDPTVTFRLIDDSGDVHFQKTLNLSELTPRSNY